MRAKEEEAWKSTPGSYAGHDDDDNWDWDGPQWSNEQKELNADVGSTLATFLALRL